MQNDIPARITDDKQAQKETARIKHSIKRYKDYNPEPVQEIRISKQERKNLRSIEINYQQFAYGKTP